jgi:hypothetical protein
MPSALAATVCTEFIKVISRLLDEALDYQQPPQASSALPMTPNPHETENINITSANSTTTIPLHLPGETDIPGSQQQQLQGLMLDGGPMESLWFGMGMEYGVGDDAFHGLGRGLVSDGMNWLDELGLNTDLDDGGVGS